MAISIFIWLMTATALAYLLVMTIITLGWLRLRTPESQRPASGTPVSVIIAVRNEENNIINLLTRLYQQDYPGENTEVILVDDHSEDHTRKLIGKFRKTHGISNIILEKSSGRGKKAALAQGVKLASGELILTTDADCEMNSGWVSGMVAFYRQYNPKLMFGPVVHAREKGLLQKFFSLDFLGLVASGAGSSGFKLPLMANGANLAFPRKAFEEAGPEMAGNSYASGDDVFLLHQVSKKYGSQSVQFIRDPHLTVVTASPENIRQFLSQRMRWASKARGYRTSWAVLVSLSVVLFNFALVLTFVAGFFQSWFFAIFLLYLLLKFLADLPLLYFFTGFADKRHLRKLILPFEFFVPFYVGLTAFLSLFFSFSWKGRRGVR